MLRWHQFRFLMSFFSPRPLASIQAGIKAPAIQRQVHGLGVRVRFQSHFFDAKVLSERIDEGLVSVPARAHALQHTSKGVQRSIRLAMAQALLDACRGVGACGGVPGRYN